MPEPDYGATLDAYDAQLETRRRQLSGAGRLTPQADAQFSEWLSESKRRRSEWEKAILPPPVDHLSDENVIARKHGLSGLLTRFGQGASTVGRTFAAGVPESTGSMLDYLSRFGAIPPISPAALGAPSPFAPAAGREQAEVARVTAQERAGEVAMPTLQAGGLAARGAARGVETRLGITPEEKRSLPGQFGGGAASVVPPAALAMLTGNPLAGAMVGFGTSYAMEGGGAFEEANEGWRHRLLTERGLLGIPEHDPRVQATFQEAARRAMGPGQRVGLFGAATETVPGAALAARAGGKTLGPLARLAAKYGKPAVGFAEGLVGEGLQEAATQVAQEFEAHRGYDPTRSLAESARNVGMAGLMGAAIGGPLGLAGGIVDRRRDALKDAETRAEQKRIEASERERVQAERAQQEAAAQEQAAAAQAETEMAEAEQAQMMQQAIAQRESERAEQATVEAKIQAARLRQALGRPDLPPDARQAITERLTQMGEHVPPQPGPAPLPDVVVETPGPARDPALRQEAVPAPEADESSVVASHLARLRAMAPEEVEDVASLDLPELQQPAFQQALQARLAEVAQEREQQRVVQEAEAQRVAQQQAVESEARRMEAISAARQQEDAALPSVSRQADLEAVRRQVMEPESAPLPSWAREEMARQGKNPARIMNEPDVASHAALLASDPLIARIAKTDPVLAERASRGEASREELRPYLKVEGAALASPATTPPSTPAAPPRPPEPAAARTVQARADLPIQEITNASPVRSDTGPPQVGGGVGEGGKVARGAALQRSGAQAEQAVPERVREDGGRGVRAEAQEEAREGVEPSEAQTEKPVPVVATRREEAGTEPVATAAPEPLAPKKRKRLVSDETAAQVRKRIQESERDLTAGLNPRLLADVATLLVYDIESGVHKFADASERLAGQFGEWVRPYLREAWAKAVEMLRGKGFDTAKLEGPEAAEAATNEPAAKPAKKPAPPVAETPAPPATEAPAAAPTDAPKAGDEFIIRLGSESRAGTVEGVETDDDGKTWVRYRRWSESAGEFVSERRGLESFQKQTASARPPTAKPPTEIEAMAKELRDEGVEVPPDPPKIPPGDGTPVPTPGPPPRRHGPDGLLEPTGTKPPAILEGIVPLVEYVRRQGPLGERLARFAWESAIFRTHTVGRASHALRRVAKTVPRAWVKHLGVVVGREDVDLRIREAKALAASSAGKPIELKHAKLNLDKWETAKRELGFNPASEMPEKAEPLIYEWRWWDDWLYDQFRAVAPEAVAGRIENHYPRLLKEAVLHELASDPQGEISRRIRQKLAAFLYDKPRDFTDEAGTTKKSLHERVLDGELTEAAAMDKAHEEASEMLNAGRFGAFDLTRRRMGSFELHRAGIFDDWMVEDSGGIAEDYFARASDAIMQYKEFGQEPSGNKTGRRLKPVGDVVRAVIRDLPHPETGRALMEELFHIQPPLDLSTRRLAKVARWFANYLYATRLNAPGFLLVNPLQPITQGVPLYGSGNLVRAVWRNLSPRTRGESAGGAGFGISGAWSETPLHEAGAMQRVLQHYSPFRLISREEWLNNALSYTMGQAYLDQLIAAARGESRVGAFAQAGVWSPKAARAEMKEQFDLTNEEIEKLVAINGDARAVPSRLPGMSIAEWAGTRAAMRVNPRGGPLYLPSPLVGRGAGAILMRLFRTFGYHRIKELVAHELPGMVKRKPSFAINVLIAAGVGGEFIALLKEFLGQYERESDYEKRPFYRWFKRFIEDYALMGTFGLMERPILAITSPVRWFEGDAAERAIKGGFASLPGRVADAVSPVAIRSLENLFLRAASVLKRDDATLKPFFQALGDSLYQEFRAFRDFNESYRNVMAVKEKAQPDKTHGYRFEQESKQAKRIVNIYKGAMQVQEAGKPEGPGPFKHEYDNAAQAIMHGRPDEIADAVEEALHAKALDLIRDAKHAKTPISFLDAQAKAYQSVREALMWRGPLGTLTQKADVDDDEKLDKFLAWVRENQQEKRRMLFVEGEALTADRMKALHRLYVEGVVASLAPYKAGGPARAKAPKPSIPRPKPSPQQLLQFDEEEEAAPAAR